MSLFRKPKKIQRRVFSAVDEEEEALSIEGISGDGDNAAMQVEYDELVATTPQTTSTSTRKKDANKIDKISGSSKALLSFVDDEDESEVFQVRKSSHSKKVMRMMDKERRKKKREERDGKQHAVQTGQYNEQANENDFKNGGSKSSSHANGQTGATQNSGKLKNSNTMTASASAHLLRVKNADCGNATVVGTVTSSAHEEQCTSNKTDSIQTEIRTDDFVVRLLLSNFIKFLKHFKYAE